MPGIQYFAGTHLNPNVTWWDKSKPFFDYINRCQFVLSQGQFVADVCYYYGDHVPNFAQHKQTDPANILPGYDYDVITEEVILEHATVEEGRICLPSGMRYRVLVLRDHDAISLPVLRKVKQLVEAGATVIGTKPTGAMSLNDNDKAITELAEELWGRGRIIDNKTAREVLLSQGIKPDFEAFCENDAIDIDFIHRRDEETEIYFVANRNEQPGSVTCTFRVHGRAPELWDPVSGGREFASAYSQADGRTTLPIEFKPCGSVLVIFRQPAEAYPASKGPKTARPTVVQEITGPWSVAFDPNWGGPGEVEFPNLSSWPEHELAGVKYYSGTAIYRKAIEIADRSSLWLDLGKVRELAEVKLNGQSCGIVWSPPFRVDISHAIQPGVNKLEIEVVNFWPNRIIGDASLPESERLTRTNIRELKADTKLVPSGLLGPVRILPIEQGRLYAHGLNGR